MDIFEVNGETVRRLREESGWSREYLSEITEVPKRTIEDIETGKSKNPSLEIIKRLLSAFPKPVNEPSRNQLLGAVVSALATMNERQLGDVLDSISIYAASSALLKAPLTDMGAVKLEFPGGNKKRKG